VSEIMQWFWIILLSIMPISELRGAIPISLGSYNMNPYIAVPIIIIANMLPVPFILKFLGPIETFLRRWKLCDRLMTWLFNRTRNRTRKHIEQWEGLALIIFVAIPLPLTGAWTGSLVAYLFNLDFKKSIIYIFIGVCIAASIVTFATLAGIALLSI
jgi:uncharacterized membrane protein